MSLLLADQGVPAVAPLLSSAGNAWERVEDYLMIVYPMIDGAPIVAENLTARDWQAVGSVLRAVHEAVLPSAVKGVLLPDKAMFVP